MENNLKKQYMFNQIMPLCTWTIVSQLYLNKVYTLRKKKLKKREKVEKHQFWSTPCLTDNNTGCVMSGDSCFVAETV